MPECEPFVVEPQQVEDGGMEIIYMNPISAYPDPVVVGFPVYSPRLDPSSGEP